MRALFVCSLLVVTGCAGRDDAPDPTPAPTRHPAALAPERALEPEPPQVEEEAGVASSTPEPSDLDAWLSGPLRGGCCTYSHGLGPAQIRATEDGYELLIREDLRVRCAIEFTPAGRPLSLSGCRVSPPWVIGTPKIWLRCQRSGGRERCTGDYHLIAPELGADAIVIERAADDPPPAPPPSEEERTWRERRWIEGTVRIVWPGASSWVAHVVRREDGFRLRTDPQSNLRWCRLEMGPDGHPSRLWACVPESRNWRPARRSTALRCTTSESGSVRCSGQMPFRDDNRTYSGAVRLHLAAPSTPRPSG